MRLMKFVKAISLCYLILASFAPVQFTVTIYPSSFKTGTVDEDVPNPAVNVGQLQDKAYTYTGVDCVVDYYGITIDDYVTIVVIDDGLTELEWKALEQNPEANVDIIGFLTNDTEHDVTYITNPDDSLLDDQVQHGHGFAVISVLAAIARDLKVIFVDYRHEPGEDPDDWDTFGFDYGIYEIWEWIDDNQASKDIDIISWSWVHSINFTTPAILQKWSSLISKDVIMLTAAGNFCNYLNQLGIKYYKYQSYYTEWYSVGSIDHEDRSEPWSWKNQKSYFSSWYEDNEAANQIVNWLEPGNGVPVLVDAFFDQDLQIARGEWVYSDGTSYSTAYLAAIVALIITGYHNGIGSSTDPSLDKVIDILQYASSRSTFDQQMGYGYVDAYRAYQKAYMEGRWAA